MKKLKDALDTAIDATQNDDVTVFREAIEYLLLTKGVIDTCQLVAEKERKGITIFASVLSHCATACYGVLAEYQLVQIKEVSPSFYKDMVKVLPSHAVAAFIKTHFSLIMNHTMRPDIVLEAFLLNKIISVEDCRALLSQKKGLLLSHKYEVLYIIMRRIMINQGEVSISTLCLWLNILGLSEEYLFRERISLDLVIQSLKREGDPDTLYLSELFACITDKRCVEELAFPTKDSPLDRVVSEINYSAKLDVSEVTELQLLNVLNGLRLVMSVGTSVTSYGSSAYRAMKKLLLAWLTSHDVDAASWASRQADLPKELKALCTEVGLWRIINKGGDNADLAALYELSPFMFESALTHSDLWRAHEDCMVVFEYDLSQRTQVNSDYVLSLYAAMRSANEKEGVNYGRTALLFRYIEKLDWGSVDLVKGQKVMEIDDINQWRVCYEVNDKRVYRGFIMLLMLCRFGLAAVAAKVKSEKMLDSLLSFCSPLDVLAHIPDYNRRWKKELMLRMA